MPSSSAGRAFVDTSVLVYADDGADGVKRDAARRLLEAEADLVVSTQVLLDFVVTRRLAQPLSQRDAGARVAALAGLNVVPADTELVLQAVETARAEHLSIWDAMIVRAAVAGHCERLLSEDFQSGRLYDGVLVENPFLSPP
jgi:predicted nucleic acid-binding protein